VIPADFATLLTFLGLIAPGLVYQVVLERRLPRRVETVFREASRVALTSLVFTLSATVLLLAIQRGWDGAPLPDLSTWTVQGATYVSGHVFLVVTGLAAEVTLACLFSASTALLSTRKVSATLSPNGAWFQMFRKDRPPRTRPWVHLVLTGGGELWGHLRHYTQDDSLPVREIVLGGNTLRWRRSATAQVELIGESWDAVLVNAKDVSMIRVVYQDEKGRLRGRRTRDNPYGPARPSESDPAAVGRDADDRVAAPKPEEPEPTAG
jgi:hypothetical protein